MHRTPAGRHSRSLPFGAGCGVQAKSLRREPGDSCLTAVHRVRRQALGVGGNTSSSVSSLLSRKSDEGGGGDSYGYHRGCGDGGPISGCSVPCWPLGERSYRAPGRSQLVQDQVGRAGGVAAAITSTFPRATESDITSGRAWFPAPLMFAS